MGCVHPSQNQNISRPSNAHGGVLAVATQSIKSGKLTAICPIYLLLVLTLPRMACSISLRGSLAHPTQFHLMMTTSAAQQKVQSIMRSSSHRGMVCLGHISTSNVVLIVSIIAPNYPHSFHGLGHKIGHPNLPNLIQRYLFEKAHPPRR